MITIYLLLQGCGPAPEVELAIPEPFNVQIQNMELSRSATQLPKITCQIIGHPTEHIENITFKLEIFDHSNKVMNEMQEYRTYWLIGTHNMIPADTLVEEQWTIGNVYSFSKIRIKIHSIQFMTKQSPIYCDPELWDCQETDVTLDEPDYCNTCAWEES